MNLEDNYDDMIAMLTTKEPFSFVRYGDGEFGLILKDERIWNHLSSKWGQTLLDQAGPLRAIIESGPKYILGVQEMAYRLWPEQLDALVPESVYTVQADCLHRRSEVGTIDSFFDALSDRNVILVGPSYLSGYCKHMGWQLITSIQDGSWRVWEDIYYKVVIAINKMDVEQNKKDPVVLYSASIASKLCIDRVYNEFGNVFTQIDTGSLFDPYVGVISRKYHHAVVERLVNSK